MIHAGDVVQLVSMPVCHTGGREFESRRPRQAEPERALSFSGAEELILGITRASSASFGSTTKGHYVKPLQ